MESKRSFVSFSSDSIPVSMDRKREPLLPYSEIVSEKMAVKLRNPLGHCLYKRIIIWTALSLFMAAFVLFGKHDGTVQPIASGHGTTKTDASFLDTNEPTTEDFYEDNGEDWANDEAQRIIDAASKGQDQLQIQVTPSKNEKRPSQDESRVADQEEDGEDDEKSAADDVRSANSQLPPSEKSNGKGSKSHAGGQSGTGNLVSDADEAGQDDEELEDEDVPEYNQNAEESEMNLLLEGENTEQLKQELENLKRMPWLRFPHLNAYFHGLKTLVSKTLHNPEYPNPERSGPFKGRVPLRKEVPKPVPYSPYEESDSIQTCYLDKENKIPAPNLYAYNGVPRHMPDPALGSYSLFGMRDDICFDRFGRYGPYGLGYRLAKGGTSVGLNTESSNSDTVWEKSGQIDYSSVDWGNAQERCSERHWSRYRQVDPKTDELEAPSDSKKSRQAIVIRLYTGFKWTYLAVLNFRALITEVSLKSGGEYTVHFLMHVRDDEAPIWSDDVTVQRILDTNVPPEFHDMVSMWSEAQMRLFYPGKFSAPIQNPSGADIHGVYRSAHLPLQVFSMQHQEYEHIWNWEMDMRFLGNYYELFDRLGKWADKQSRVRLWERSARYYIPALHGDWDNFTETVERQTTDEERQHILGPLQFHGKRPLRHEQRGESILPASCAVGRDESECGVGEPADLITLNPLFDADNSGWVFAYDTTGYPSNPPRRCAIITASRLSRRLLAAMHEEVWRHHHSMFAEMFPPSVALHHGFKAAYAPHPLYIDRAWNPLGGAVDEAFNGGQDHSTSGPGSPFDLTNEHNHKGVSWYYNSEFSGLLWRRWLGYAQLDGRGRGGGEGNRGTMRGGREEESREGGTGRMCLRSMLLHPIKFEDPDER
ncbi:hypothetical protein ISF_01992 [Cordyceps fumosorosea ARSEF 2679]|uniref:Major facilitator superfamily transporter n=1 Tax=Cordyceps fumosorosea (strain ARSEF 2679) TaxID=1081104 RepID=A0A168CJ47_CORFA|nr:hypothetical protein ISF_01992 [Cordyceps fumosorosea ARSEF 2679]OAA71441.1 hypothetical protein ISF_01992 [Cordyceps fumosorosea ARSEF 2679]